MLNDAFWFGMGSCTTLVVIVAFLRIGLKIERKPLVKPTVLIKDFENTHRINTPYTKVVNLAEFRNKLK